MKKLLTAILILAAFSISCSKKNVEDTQPPAADSNVKNDDSNAKNDDSNAKNDDSNAKNDDSNAKNDDSNAKNDDSNAKNDDSNAKNDIGTGRPAKEFDGNTLKIAADGPSFSIIHSEDSDKLVIKRTDADAKPLEYHYENELYSDDFNFDGFQDFAFRETAADFDHYRFLIWNNDEQKFDDFKYSTASGITLYPKSKTISLNTFSYFYVDGPAGCEIQLAFNGTKPVQKSWNPNAKDDSIRITVPAKDMNQELFNHLESLTFEFRNDGDDVKCFIIDCKTPEHIFTIKDAVTKDMIKKDINNDGIVDLQFHAKSDPSKLIDVLWQKESNTFESTVDEENEEMDGEQ